MITTPGELPAGVDPLVRTFVDATVDVPQVPYEGMIRVGSDAVDRIEEDPDFWQAYGDMHLVPGTPGYMFTLTETIAAHRDAEVPNNQGLRDGIPFAWELVQSGVIRAIALLSREDDSVETRQITPIDRTELEASKNFLVSAENRQLVRSLFKDISDRLAISEEVQEYLPVYRREIAAISREYAGLRKSDPGYDAKIEEKRGKINFQRGQLMRRVAPEILAAVEARASRVSGVRAFAGAIACGIPSDELLNLYKTADE